MDEFAQSREDNDLFADEFEPLPEPTTTVDDTKAKPPVHSQSTDTSNIRSGAPDGPRGHRSNRGQGQGRSRGRGGGGGPSQNNGLSQSKYAPKPESTSTSAPPAAEASPSEPQDISAATEPQSESTQPTTTESTPQPTSTRTPAVRGDRSATGGPAHKKLTEEELTLKLAQMAILNAQKAEKHRLQEADQAAFQHREKELAKERREKQVAEKKNSRQMEMERAKNRQRKINAQGGREWDSEKVESDIVDGKGRGRSSEYVRGGHGGVIKGRGSGLAGSRFAEEDDSSPAEGNGNSRGRGGFEIRGRGRGGRGGRGGNRSAPITKPAGDWYGLDENFPSLPTPASKPDKPDSKVEETIKSPTISQPAGEWAEEMATPVEEKHEF